MKKVKSLQDLKQKINDGHHDFFIQLNFGLRSSKYIDYDESKFYILNEIDDTEQLLTDEEIMDENLTNIGVAITKGALWAY